MKKSIAFILFLMLMLVGCGHNISVYSKGVGAELSWRPNTLMPSIRFGSFENVDIVQRENNHVRYTSNNGVGFDWFGLKSLFTGKKENDIGMGTVLEVKTGPQINGYVEKVMQNEYLSEQHVEIIKAITEVDNDLGDGEAQVTLGSAKANATPVVVTEKGTFGSVTVTTPANQYTQEAIKEQVKTTGIHDLAKAWGFYIICAVIVLILALAFVIVHLLQKSSDLRKMVEDMRAISGR